MRERGSIKWFSPQKKFGYILTDKANEELFFHINDCGKFPPKEGLRVEFDLGSDRIGRKKAINIKSVCVGVSGDRYPTI